MQVKHLYESYFLLGKNPALSEVQRYVFWLSVETLVNKEQYFSLIRSCGYDVYKVEKSKEDTWEAWKFRSRIFSMTSEDF